MKTNRKPRAVRKPVTKTEMKTTHEGASSITYLQTPLHQLRRIVLANMLFEDQFYIDGKLTADAVTQLAYKVSIEQLGDLAIEARNAFNLRHIPLLLTSVMIDRARLSKDIADKSRAHRVITLVVSRPDEMGELIAVYRKLFKLSGKMKLPSILKSGLAEAFTKFDVYQLTKYASRPAAITLRDVMFLVHPKPISDVYAALYKGIANRTVASPPTWEVRLSSGEDKKNVFTDLLKTKKLGGLAFLRNLRNITQSGVDRDVVREAFKTADKSMSRVLPFRFLSSAKHAPDYRQELHDLFLSSMANRKKLPGSTLIVVDVSGSMQNTISGNSEMTRNGAAAALAAIGRELCEDVALVVTGNTSVEVKSTLRGLDAAESLYKSTEARSAGYGGIYLTQCMNWCQTKFKGRHFDRVIVVTDEQDCGHGANDPSNAPLIGKFNYLINVGAYQSGIAHNKWLTISGFSDAVFDYMAAVEGAFDVE